MKATALYDVSNANYEAAYIAMDSVIKTAGMEQGDFPNADVVFIYAMVNSRAAMNILAKHYTPGKFFCVICLEHKGASYGYLGDLPPNVWWPSQEDVLGGNLAVIIREDLPFIPSKIALAKNYASHLETDVVCVDGGSGIKILVADDKEVNRIKALMELSAHNLTVASSYGQTMDLLATERFDVVLTDCHLPVSNYHGNDMRCCDIGRLVPYGFLIANEAKMHGARVAIVTDTGHHANDPIGAALHKNRNNAEVVVYNIYKDWKRALSDLGH